MELAIEQLLQQGVAAHKEGKLQDAERLYRAILQTQPLHPDANHNLGVLAISVNKVSVALPLFKCALEVNPKIERFWLSYIEALIQEKQFENAKQIIEQGKTQGVAEEKLDALEAELTSSVRIKEPIQATENKSLSLSQKRQKLAAQNEQKKAKKQKFEASGPSQQQIGTLTEHFQNGRFGDAEKLAERITREFPEHQLSWKVLGAVLGVTGRKPEAVDAHKTAVALSPQDAEAHYNLGVELQALGRLEEAEASYTQAITLVPEYAEAYSNFGVTLQALGRLDEAEASYAQAIALRLDFVEAHNNLGQILFKKGQHREGLKEVSKGDGLITFSLKSGLSL